MIAPRLVDPRAKSEYFIGLFRFSEQKDIVKAALKSRMHTINSAIFSRTEISHSSPSMDDSALLSTPQSKLMRRLTNMNSRSSGRGSLSRMRKREEESSMKDDITLTTTSRESSQNDVASASSTPIKSTVRNLAVAMDDDFLSPYNLDKVIKSPKKSIAVTDSMDEYEGNHHTNNSFSAISHTEFANNVFSTPSAQVEIADKAHRLGQQYQSSTNANFHNNKRSSERYFAAPIPDDSTSNRFSDCGLVEPSSAMSTSQSNNQKSSQASTITLSVPTLAGETTLPLPSPLDGWLCKYSRRGIFKNWKRRYFVLKEGKLTYYGEMSSPMVGKTLKVN